MTLVGFVGLVYRRATSDRVRGTTTRTDLLTYLLLTVLIVMGCWMTFGYTLFTSDPYDYRVTIGDWWRSLFYLRPDVDAATSAPLHLPAARDHRLGLLGGVPVQPAGARLEHPAAVHRPPVHPLPAALPTAR